MVGNPATRPDEVGDLTMADDGGSHTSALGLEIMPPEIIAMILDHLIPTPPEIGETRPVAYNQLMVDEPWFAFTRCRRGLHSLCRVSRRLSEMARPLLYRVVTIWDEKAMLLLFRTLCRKPEYGLWTRYLSCHITLSSLSVIREIRELLPEYQDTFEMARGDGILINAVNVSVMSPVMSHSAPETVQILAGTPSLTYW
jgi:hypothetical protein